ncbi:MFS transporter [Asanoa sp. WMMD1127]|uniref:MFS transporter n=1 Tax=Asanoa sp. WMMD1127 TaxID=3016107 RepID=UPI002415A831|nr:MFS transporter [Asanoa sp. WMMD1127]MDG4821418.1 MFS transporter [Asanoa sp. WMMD1127]
MSASRVGETQKSGTVQGSGLAEIVDALRVRPFRRLFLVLGLSALGDWLGLLAGAAFASSQVSGATAKGAAFGSVIAVQLLPAFILGPISGVIADRFDRRYTMVVSDVVRFVLFASIPIVGYIVDSPVRVVTYTAVALFLAQAASQIWTPAKEAAVPNLLPRSRLEAANQLTLATTYGVTPILAALIFSGMARLPRPGGVGPADYALLFDALTFLASAFVVAFFAKEMSGRTARPAAVAHQPEEHSVPGRQALRDLLDGGRFIVRTRLVRGIVIGVLGAFAGAGVVIGTANFYSRSLGGGDATFGILFAAIFAGFGVGIAGGPALVGTLSRRRWFALSIVLAGVAVIGLSVAPRLSLAVLGCVITGAAAGMAFLSGLTLVGGDIADDVRGRVVAFIQSAVRIVLLLSIALSSLIVGLGASRDLDLGPVDIHLSTTRLLLFVIGAAGIAVGIVAFRQIDDRPGVPVWKDIWRGVRRRPLSDTAKKRP